MVYFLIIPLTIFLSWAIINISSKKKIKSLKKIVYSQSSIYEIVKDFIPKDLFDKPKAITQSRKYMQKNMLKVVMAEGRAYWVTDNVFYKADTVDGRIDESTVEPLDMINMPKKELNKMLDILDNLKMGDGSDDNSGTGQQ